MTVSWPTVLLVLGLGVVQLAVGAVLGRFLATRRSRSGRPQRRNANRLRRFAQRIFDVATSVAEDVDQCRAQIKQVNHELTSLGPDPGDHLTESVLKSVAQIIQVNERLQTRLIAAEEKLREQTQQIETQLVEARSDPLTGLPNRRAFDDELGRRIAEWRRKNTPFCLMMIDIDHFKALNDRRGHLAGDHALRKLAGLLESTLREMDMVARVGGEEFAAVLPSTSLPDGCRAAERIRAAVASHWFEFEKTDLRLTVSLGLAMVGSADDPVSLIKRADEALYAAKRGGRNCGYFHNGRACERIKPSRPSTPDGSPLPPQGDQAQHCEMPDANEITEIGNELRDRLAQLADRAVQSPTGAEGARS